MYFPSVRLFVLTLPSFRLADEQDLYSLPVMMARMEASLVRRPDPVVMEAHVRAASCHIPGSTSKMG